MGLWAYVLVCNYVYMVRVFPVYEYGTINIKLFLSWMRFWLQVKKKTQVKLRDMGTPYVSGRA